MSLIPTQDASGYQRKNDFMATAASAGTHRHGGAKTRSRPSPSLAALELEAFSAFPYGLLVLDRDGRVLARNAQASQLVRALDLPEAGLTCCALLGCRAPDTVLEAACLTELAVGRDAALPEIRVDISSPDGPAAMWVTAAKIGGASTCVVLQLRPGVAGDRRRRTSP